MRLALWTCSEELPLPKAPSEPLALRRRISNPAKTPKTSRAKTKSESETKPADVTDYIGERTMVFLCTGGVSYAHFISLLIPKLFCTKDAGWGGERDSSPPLPLLSLSERSVFTLSWLGRGGGALEGVAPDNTYRGNSRPYSVLFVLYFLSAVVATDRQTAEPIFYLTSSGQSCESQTCGVRIQQGFFLWRTAGILESTQSFFIVQDPAVTYCTPNFSKRRYCNVIRNCSRRPKRQEVSEVRQEVSDVTRKYY